MPAFFIRTENRLTVCWNSLMSNSLDFESPNAQLANHPSFLIPSKHLFLGFLLVPSLIITCFILNFKFTKNYSGHAFDFFPSNLIERYLCLFPYISPYVKIEARQPTPLPRSLTNLKQSSPDQTPKYA